MGVWEEGREGGRQGGGNGNSDHREPERVLDEKVRSAVPHCGGWLCPCVCFGL